MEVTASVSKASNKAGQFFCQVCQGVYRQPKLLSCLHTFCKSCLASLLPLGQATFITCPLCSYQSSLPAAGVQGLADHVVLSRMCQDYLTQAQDNVRAPFSCKASPIQSVELASDTSTGVESANFKVGLSPSHQSQKGVRPEAKEGLNYAPPESTSQDLNLQTLETIQNFTKLQRKIMSLQEEALRVTYAIEQVNQSMLDWQQQQEDVKRAVQQRSVLFQVLIKRKEHQLLSQVDSKQVEDDFYTESDNCKNKLRKILRNILHEVNVLKNFQEHGTNAEINTLSPFVLGKSTGLKEVTLSKSSFYFGIPLQTNEEMLCESFGEVKLRSQDSSIFIPDILDFTTSLDNSIDVPEYSIDRKAYYQTDHNNPEMKNKSKTLSRSWSDSSTRSKPRPSWHRKCSADHLLQFQSAKETFKNQRKQILAYGQQARENALSRWDPFHWHPRYCLTKGKVQRMERTISHDQMFNTMEKTSALTVVITFKSTEVNFKTCEFQAPPSISQFETPDSLSCSSGSLSRGTIHSSINVPSPVIEEPVFHNTFRSRLLKQTCDSKQTNKKTVSHTEDTQLELTNKTRLGHLIGSSRRSFSAGPIIGHTSRRNSSDQYTINNRNYLESLQDGASNRSRRRANSSATDKTEKLEFLRDKWQKRKEILIQNEGFLPSTPPARPILQFHTHPNAKKISAPQGCQVQSTISSTKQKLPSTKDEILLTSQVNLNTDQALSDSKLLFSASIPYSADTDFSNDNQQELVKVSRNKDTLDDSYTAEQPVQTTSFRNRTKNQNQKGVNRRHTIEIGGPDIRKAMQIISCNSSSSEPDTQITTSSEDFQNTQTLPVFNSKTTSWMEETASATTAAGAPSVQDLLVPGARLLSDNYGAKTTNCQLPSTLQAMPSVTEQKLNLREITRRKRERWRHLTVH